MGNITVQELRNVLVATERTYTGLRNRRISLGGVRPSKAEEALVIRITNYRKALRKMESFHSNIAVEVPSS